LLSIDEIKEASSTLIVNSYNYEREHGGINGMTPAEKFMKCLKEPILLH
jgi:hypothetical protein